MLIKDLYDHLNHTIEVYVVKGYRIYPKKVYVKLNHFHPNCVSLYTVASNGIITANNQVVPIRDNTMDKNSIELSASWAKDRKFLFLTKEDAYRSIINKLREARQEINKKMLKVQMEAFGKKTNN